MITYRSYRAFLDDLSAQGIRAEPIDRLTESGSGDRRLFLKHDVEANLPLALKLARIEADAGHLATYYFQGDLLTGEGVGEIVREIAALGHETAYHYDVLDACNGDYAAATQEFDRFKAMVERQSGQTLRTVCPHGNPTKVRNGWRSNKDFFRNAEIRLRYPDVLDIVVDFVDRLPGGVYLSDAGFTLRRIGDIGGNDISNEAAIADGTTVDWTEIGPMVTEGRGVVLSVHSHRLRESALSLAFTRARIKVLRSGYRVAMHLPLVRMIASKFYYIARRL